MEKRIEQLSLEEKTLIQKRYKKILKWILIVDLIIVASICPFAGLFCLFAAIPVSFFTLIVVIIFSATTRKDLKDGTKTIIKGILNNKTQRTVSSGKSSTTYYYFHIDNEQISVLLNHYQKYQVGDELEMQITNGSRTVLSVVETRASFSDTEKEYLSETGYEYTEPLKYDEIELLQRIASNGLAWGIIWMFLLDLILLLPAILIYTLIFIPIEFDSGKEFLILGFDAFWFGFLMLLIFVDGRILYRRFFRIKKDIAINQKRAREYILEDKFLSNVRMMTPYRIYGWKGASPYPYIVCDKRKILVSREMYEKFQAGHKVQLAKSWYSGKLLSVGGMLFFQKKQADVVF